MATASQDFDATGTPRALEDELGLTDGTPYLVSNAGETVALFRAAAAQPDAAARGHPLGPYEDITVIPAAGLKSWVWSRHPDGASLIVTAER